MRAIVIDNFGGPDVLKRREVERPEPGPGKVLVRVIVSGTNPVDTKLRQDASWARLTPPLILGYDISGVIEEVGPGVEDLAEGDEVYYTPEIFGNSHGSYAEYNVVPAAIVARKPQNLSHEEAAAIPLAGGTAWEALVRRLELRIGETILVHGGAGGVGSFAVQLAKSMGAYVFATASAANLDFLGELGADHPIAYDSEDFVAVVEGETGGGVDAVFDTAGHDNVGRSLNCTRAYYHCTDIMTCCHYIDIMRVRAGPQRRPTAVVCSANGPFCDIISCHVSRCRKVAPYIQATIQYCQSKRPTIVIIGAIQAIPQR
ncbi:MAG: zinc-binding dehydrogenase [Actinomycetota bacterium]